MSRCGCRGQHPANVAQAAVTSASLTGGKFTLGLGTGEALNEHILGCRWPSAAERLEMLEEAVDVIRQRFTGRPRRATPYLAAEEPAGSSAFG